MNPNLSKTIRAALAIVILVVLVLVVRGYWNQYRVAQERAAKLERSLSATGSAGETTSGKPAEASPADKSTTTGKTAVVLIEGLNFRESPSAGASALRGLDKGEKVVIIKRQGSWYYVRDKTGAKGWISTNPQYIRVSSK